MSDQTTQPFIGLDPDDTAEVKVGGATFTSGVSDQGMWARTHAEAVLAYENAKRRAIKRIADEGGDPEEPVEGKTTRLDVEAYTDPTYRERLFNAQCEAVRYAVRGHEGLLKRDGTPHPFQRNTLKRDFGEVHALDEATLRLYRANPRIVEALWMPIWRLQTLGEAEKKV